MKKAILLLLLVFFSISLVNAQQTKNKRAKTLNKKVYGYVTHNNQIYLVTDNGLLNIYQNESTNKQWQDYYREIYKDSTIINPNTVIEPNLSNSFFNFIIPIKINDWINQKYSFKNDKYLYDFISFDSSGNYYYRPGILEIIGNYKKNNQLVLPKKFHK